MCLAVPVKIKELLPDDQAIVDLNGVKTTISTALVEDLNPGDYVILHVGYALSKLSEDEAKKTLELLSEMDSSEIRKGI